MNQPKPPPGDGNSVISAEAAQRRIKIALSQRVEEMQFAGLPFMHALDDIKTQYSIPIRVDSRKLAAVGVDENVRLSIELPAMTLESALRNILSSVSDDLAMTIRDEVLLITSSSDASRDQPPTLIPPALSELDSGDEFIRRWLASAQASDTNSVDGVALRTALRKHLEQEFDAKHQARQLELSRLRELLSQSEEWLKAREARRAEIIDKKVAEVMNKPK